MRWSPHPDARFLGIHFDFFDELDIQTEADMIVNEAVLDTDKFAHEAVSSAFPRSLPVSYTPRALRSDDGTNRGGVHPASLRL